MSAIDGVVVTRLTPHPDDRGVFTELFRAGWPTDVVPVQWNLVSSDANVLRGFHVHVAHTDYLTCLTGALWLGLRDIRPKSATFGRTDVLEVSAANPIAVTMPPGVAHGFYFATPSIHVYAVSHYWNLADELGCRWDDPAIGLQWPTSNPKLSERDRAAGSFDDMVDAFLGGRAKTS